MLEAAVDDEPSSQSSNRPSPQNFCAFVPYACAQYGAPFFVKINVQAQVEYIQAADKKRPRSSQRPREVPVRPSRQADTAEEHESEDPSEIDPESQLIVITVVQDSTEDVVELIFDRCVVGIPIMLIKVIALCMPYQRKLHKLTVRRTPLLAVTLYRFSKFMSQLTEVCLDGSPLAGRNHELLLAPPTRLYYLSLGSCKLEDEDCANLAEMLLPPRAAASSLHVLLLPSNRITDEGARAFAHTLRSNRGLHYLNLAGNRITDAGAISIFKILMEFPLTKDETNAKRLRRYKFLKRRNEEFAKFIKELSKDDKSITEVRTTKRNKPLRALKAAEPSSIDAIVQRANIMTDRLVGPFIDRFSNDKTLERGGTVYCVGNMALGGLNLSYNSLQYPSITWLWKVLKQQNDLASLDHTEPGLLRVRVDGNNLPHECHALQCIDELLERAVARLSRLVQGAGRGTRGPYKGRLTASSRVAMSHKAPSA